MFILNWYRQYLELKYEIQEKKQELKVCESCETLKQQLAIANIEKSQLLSRLLEKPEPEVPRKQDEEPKVIRPHLPWAARRQIIEAEDREKARLLREAPKPTNTEDLEKEVLSAAQPEEATS